MAYAPPRRASHTIPYDVNQSYTPSGEPPRIHTPQEQGLSYPPASPYLQSEHRRRGSSNASRHSQQGSPYLPPQYQQQQQQQQQQQLTPYRHPSPQQQQVQQQSGYFPPAPPRPTTPNQLHPSEAYAQDPFAYRQRRESATSHKSSHSQKSHHSSASRKSSEHWGDRREGQRATFGDSLFGIWDTLRGIIPVSKR